MGTHLIERARRLAGGPLLRAPNLRELNDYIRLACKAHYDPSSQDQEDALKWLRRVRLRLEEGFKAAFENMSLDKFLSMMLERYSPFGGSSKQGLSFRMPLSSCRPTYLCSRYCYVHDGKESLFRPIRRGVANGYIADLYERNVDLRPRIERLIQPHIHRAVWVAVDDAQKAKAWGFIRSPRIRFAQAGDMGAYPVFADAVARMVRDLSCGQVLCVVYTRYTDDLFDPELWKINFSTDPSTPTGIVHPRGSRWTFACFRGRTEPDAYVNFAQHHGEKRIKPVGRGFICPSTLPGRPHGCDANKCDRCFSS